MIDDWDDVNASITPESYIKTNNPKQLKTYLNDPKLRAINVKEHLEQWEITEFQKCKLSPKYFIENYCILFTEKGTTKFNLFPCQKKTIDIIDNDRFTIILAPRQSGKCVKSNTKIKVRNKKTGVIEKISIGEFHNKNKSLPHAKQDGY